MQDLDARTALGWLFGIEGFLTLPTHLWIAVHPTPKEFGFLSWRDLLFAMFFVVSITISVVACLTVLKRRPSARGWAIAASFSYILLYLLQETFIWWHGLINLLLGLIGLMIFSRHLEPKSTSS